MVSIFSTGYANNKEIKSYKDKNLIDFDKSLNSVLKNLAKSVAADGEGASKFVTIKVEKCKNENDAKKSVFLLLTHLWLKQQFLEKILIGEE